MEIPEMVVRVMRSRGWDEGAALLQHWLDYPSNSDPSQGIPDLSTISVAWTLGFSRAAEVYKDALNSKIWTTEDAKARIRRTIDRHYANSSSKKGVLRVDNVGGSDPGSFSSKTLAGIYGDRVAYTPMDDLLVPLDGLTAALGRFGYYFNVSGSFVKSANSYQVQIDSVGIYIRDTFDFSGSQHLGFWDIQDSYVARLDPVHCWDVVHRGYLSQMLGTHHIPGEPEITFTTPVCGMATHVTNGDFRDYRKRMLKGSDFYVYSDISYISTNDRLVV